ncbi:MAG: RIP metalloprotease RseP [Verrucomicrobiota bacterium]
MLTFLWSALMIAVFFGGSIFVHELGHFLAARKRGLKVERFSIGFGPRIAGWKGKDGVDYRLSLLPFGGYVALPQLADMSAIEGKSEKPDPSAEALPPITYTTKVIVFVAGAVFNLLFAFALASVLWFVGQPVSKEDQTTRVGHVQPVVTLTDGSTVPGPALEAGIRQGDVILKVDGKSVATFNDINTLVALGAGRTAEDKPSVELTVLRDDQTLLVPVIPAYSGDEAIREIGIEPAVQPMVADVMSGTPAEAAGLQPGDTILALDGQPAEYISFVSEYLRLHGANPVRVTYEREGQTGELTVTPRMTMPPGATAPVPLIGVSLGGNYSRTLVHIAPWQQMWNHAVTTWRTLSSLVHPKSDIGPSKLSGPVGIARVFHITAQIDIRLVLWFTVLVNVNLAMLNLLPIPVLDGGHIAFATVAKLRGRPLPMQAIATVQSVFMVLLFTMILYVTFFDFRRIARDGAPAPEAPRPTPTATPAAP